MACGAAAANRAAHRGEQPPAEAGAHTDHEGGAALRADNSEAALGVLPGIEDRAGGRKQRIARRRQADRPPVTNEQLDPQLGLQGTDLLGERRLADKQRLGGLAEGQVLSHRHEVTQVPQMNVHAIWLSQQVLDAGRVAASLLWTNASTNCEEHHMTTQHPQIPAPRV